MSIFHKNVEISVLITTMTQLITLSLVHACWLINVHAETYKIDVVCLICK